MHRQQKTHVEDPHHCLCLVFIARRQLGYGGFLRFKKGLTDIRKTWVGFGGGASFPGRKNVLLASWLSFSTIHIHEDREEPVLAARDKIEKKQTSEVRGMELQMFLR